MASKKRGPSCKGTEYWPRVSSLAKTLCQNASEGVGSQCQAASMLQGAEQQEGPALSRGSQVWRACESH